MVESSKIIISYLVNVCQGLIRICKTINMPFVF